ncbi:MAG: glycosyltransferase, partial [Patescibacteria group bacterium]
IILGEGDNKYREFFTQLEHEFPKQVGTHLMNNWQLPRKIFAGCDMLLLPSKFEPGGIVVMEGMRYGAVPIVRATGGLADIVEDYNIGKNTGTGFTFKEYSELSFFGALTRALEIYRCGTMWQSIVRRAMLADFSWKSSAIKYVDLYQRAIEYHKEMLSENPSEAFRK